MRRNFSLKAVFIFEFIPLVLAKPFCITMRPIAIPANIEQHNQPNNVLLAGMDTIRAGFQRLLKGPPEVSVVMPAYNEEESILKTLSCLSQSVTNRSVEVIVVNNNSKDNTEDIVNSTGARCIKETKQGITPARNAGLAAATGQIYFKC